MGLSRSARSAGGGSTYASFSSSSPPPYALGFGGQSSNEYSTPAISDAPADVALEFARMLEDCMRGVGVGGAADPRVARRAACCAAMVETAMERRSRRCRRSGGADVGEDDRGDSPVTPNEIFVVAIAALTSLQTSLEARQKSLISSTSSSTSSSTDDDVFDVDAAAESIARELEDTALPVLELLRRVLPYVAHRSNNSGAMLSHQFGALSRMLRLFVALGYALPAAASGGGLGDGGGDGSQRGKRKKDRTRGVHSSPQRRGEGGAGVAGANALLRQVLRTTTTLLLVAPPVDVASGKVSEKDLARLLHATIVPMFHDRRPKVRKAAWGCGMEIVVAASSSSSSSSSSPSVDGDDDADGVVIARMVQRQRRVVADFLWEYCHAVIANRSREEATKEAPSRLVHVLRFLSCSLPFADDGRIRVRFGECCLATLDGGGESASAEVAREALAVLLSCLETTERERASSRDDRASGTAAAADGRCEEASTFSARCLAFLLRHRPRGANGTDSYDGDDDVNAAYGRCMLACVERMLGKTKGGSAENDDGEDRADVPAQKLLAMKLIPNVLTSMLNICEASSSGSAGGVGGRGRGRGGADDDDGSDRYDSCGSAFNQFVSHVVSHLDPRETNNIKLHRVTLETLPLCIPIVKRALQIQYRSAWGSILSGGYATFTVTLARHLLERRSTPSSSAGAAGSDNDVNFEFQDQLSSWVRTLVLSLLRLHEDVAKGGGAARTAVEYATSTIIRGMGVELFLGVVDFVDEDGDGGGGTKKNSLSSSSTTGGGIRDDRAWLLPLMKQCASSIGSRSATTVDDDGITTKTHLSFFQGNVLNLARKCDAASADGHRTAAETSIQKARVVELWSLFPIFCVYPLDVKENLGSIAKTVVKALGDHGRYPKLIPIICGGLKDIAIGIMERANVSPETADDYTVLSNVSTKILPSLFKLVETLNESSSKESSVAMDIDVSSSKESQSQNQQNMQLVEAVTDAIGQLAQICPPEFLQTLFKKVVQRLLMATTKITEALGDKDAKNAIAMRMVSMLGLGQALVASGSLDNSSVALLYRAVRPLVRTDEHDPRVQKRAYKVLAEICERHKEFVTSDERLEEMTDLVVDSIVTCQVSARNMRIKCMTHIVQGFNSNSQTHMAVIPKIMGEVLLCLKDSNAKTREAAYQLLLAMALARDDMTDYFRIVLAALGAQTSHMRSAAVMALSRLAFEYAREDNTVQELLPSLMQTVSVLFDDSSREVTKSVIGFVRVCVAAMTRDQLEPLLPEVVGGIMKYNKGKDRFRAKIKIILKKLVRVYGFDVIAPLVPEEHTRLITHMRKLSERAARRKAAGVQDGRSDVQNDFDHLMNSDEDDSDDGRTFMTGVTGFTKMTAMSGKTTRFSTMDRSVKSQSVISGVRSTMRSKSAKVNDGPRIKAELNGEILDMLDASKMARSVHFADAHDSDYSDDDDDDGADDFQFDNQGRIVISDGMPKPGRNHDAIEDDSDDDENHDLKGAKRRRVSKFESVKIAKAEKDAQKGRMQKTKKDSTASLGAAYKSKKAGGDVKKKGQKYDPYAYVPLDARDFTKKNRGKAVSKMSSVVRGKRKRG